MDIGIISFMSLLMQKISDEDIERTSPVETLPLQDHETQPAGFTFSVAESEGLLAGTYKVTVERV